MPSSINPSQKAGPAHHSIEAADMEVALVNTAKILRPKDALRFKGESLMESRRVLSDTGYIPLDRLCAFVTFFRNAHRM